MIPRQNGFIPLCSSLLCFAPSGFLLSSVKMPVIQADICLFLLLFFAIRGSDAVASRELARGICSAPVILYPRC
ncbi:hypothetical protein BZA70DRAFT_275094 [Myxozyma melibiosi]|uniref:Secreted protein n=1 Tax=Myxozyma melibiosi TaxID=54550 RepID=A0ABR1FAC0_9ASCO